VDDGASTLVQWSRQRMTRAVATSSFKETGKLRNNDGRLTDRLVARFVTLFEIFSLVMRDMRRGLREMKHLTREVEALLDDGAPRHA